MNKDFLFFHKSLNEQRLGIAEHWSTGSWYTVLDGLSGGQVLKVKELLLMFLINMFLACSIIRYRY
ncbi:hypothetical protein GBA52_005774 [Prunus armeniaca]|nr:hypothetical protein GBA52_005774 [Prunus armeniaca]